MTIQEQIRTDMIQSMKAKTIGVTSILRVVAGEFGRIGKEVSDEQAIKIIRKMHENALELGDKIEAEILEKYIPSMLEPIQIKTIVAGIIRNKGFSGMQDMGKVMGEIKKLPMASQIDGKLSSSIVRELLSATS